MLCFPRLGYQFLDKYLKSKWLSVFLDYIWNFLLTLGQQNRYRFINWSNPQHYNFSNDVASDVNFNHYYSLIFWLTGHFKFFLRTFVFAFFFFFVKLTKYYKNNEDKVCIKVYHAVHLNANAKSSLGFPFF